MFWYASSIKSFAHRYSIIFLKNTYGRVNLLKQLVKSTHLLQTCNKFFTVFTGLSALTIKPILVSARLLEILISTFLTFLSISIALLMFGFGYLMFIIVDEWLKF